MRSLERRIGMSTITQARKNSRSLRLAMETADWFFANSLDVFLIVRDGVIEQASPSLSNFLGWHGGEAVGRSFAEFAHPKDLDAIAAAVAEVAATGSATYEHRALTKWGEWRGVRCRIKRSGDGASIVIMQDIAEERRRLQEAAESSSTYCLLSTASGVSLWRYHPQADECELDPDFSLPFLETPTERRISIDVAHKGIHAEDSPIVEVAWRRTVLTGKLTIIEYREQADDGGWRRLRSAWMGVRQHQAGGWEVVGVCQNLTELMAERDRAVRGEEAARAAAEAKSQFLANVSHELRTPMNGVLGGLYLLRNAESPSERQRLVDEAIKAGGDLSRLLGDIVDFADTEAGRVRIEPVPVDIKDLIEGLGGAIREQAADKGLSFRITNSAKGWVRIDPARVRQILCCLLSNAIKFTETGGVDLRVRSLGAGDDARLEFEIEDTGVGIAWEKQDALFEQFHQADGSATRRYGGVGLGLARARALAELMDGAIQFTSAASGRSTFCVTLAAPDCPVENELNAPVLSGLRVLLVEDNPTNRLVGAKILESLGAEVFCAEDGQLGVEAAYMSFFDLIFVDIQMPVMDGMEASRRIRTQGGPNSITPIVALTANALDHQIRAYRECGMNGCIPKPVSPGAVIAEIARLSGGEVSAANAA